MLTPEFKPKNLIDGQHPFVQIFILFSLCILCSGIFSIIALVLTKPLFHVEGIDKILEQAMKNPDKMAQNEANVSMLKFLQIMGTVGMFLVPAILFALLKPFNKDFYRLKKKLNLQQILLAVLVVTFTFPLISLLIDWNMHLHLPWKELQKKIDDEQNANDTMENIFLNMPSLGYFFFNLLLMAILPAICEELIFRGCAIHLFSKWFKNMHVAIWVSAAVFSFIHFQFYGFVPRMMLGALFGYLFYWSGTLWVPIFSHIIWNTYQLILSYMFQHNIGGINPDSDAIISPLVVIVSTVIFVAALYLFFKKSKERNQFLNYE